MLYDIAGLKVLINNRLGYTARFCEKYLAEDQTVKPDMSITVTDDEFYSEKSGTEGFSDGYIENLCIYRKICNLAPQFDRFLLHSSVVEYGDAAYAFLGRSGAGKSTHSKLWLENLPTAKILNGDKPIVGYENGKFYVYGTPWQGKENFGYAGKAELKAACFIRQSKSNAIARISEGDFAESLFTQTLIPSTENGAARTLELLDILVKTVPAFVLDCDISREAFETSFKAMVTDL